MADATPSLSLTKKQQKVLLKLSQQDGPDKARAAVILAVAEGLSQAEAAAKSGLTTAQLRYWLGRFRSKQLDCFASLNTDSPAKSKPQKADKTKSKKKTKKDAKKTKKTDNKKAKKAKKSAKKKSKK